ncbi:alpha-glucan family phosphorylase [Chitinophaga agri]|uniref:glycogen phosphorylase n=1 Tax=Chitinophaga agri TaxID=2703787 RepID=A0A6B9Z7F8_9BACT|nr:alpha-glucan family phosphorylase [Chitinophaga agri]QHS58162.1 alpha-glucan family phosphorylase [Chitinophaga agri]
MDTAGNEYLTPDHLFEISWEVCNKVGGIHTVVSTKAGILQENLKDRYILIGPDLLNGNGQAASFTEDRSLFPVWRDKMAAEGWRIKTGRWNIPGTPLVILVDFTSLYPSKDDILAHLWNTYRLDSLSGQWDYIDPALFGYAAGQIIESLYQPHINASEHIVAQFHEWMTGTGILYLEEHAPQIATIFTTHATVLGRTLSGAGQPLSGHGSPASVAASYNVTSKHSLEQSAASIADCFTCVSETTARECKSFLGRYPDFITPNGFDLALATNLEQQRHTARRTLLTAAGRVMQQTLPDDCLLVLKSGRYEFHNKGIDVFIEALAALKTQTLPRTVIAFIFIPAANTGHINEHAVPGFGDHLLTHYLYAPDKDAIFRSLQEKQLNNTPDDRVKVIYAPVYLNGNDGIFNLSYYELLPGFDLAIFPSCYEPWGYPPLESLAFHVPALTTSLSGFGQAASELPAETRMAITILDRSNVHDTALNISAHIMSFLQRSPAMVNDLRENAGMIAAHFRWETLLEKYLEAYNFALHKSRKREGLYHDKPQATPLQIQTNNNASATWHEINISASFPSALAPLLRLSKNLWWSWHSDAGALFQQIDPMLWEQCREDPLRMLHNLSYEQLDALTRNHDFLNDMRQQEKAFDLYMHTPQQDGPNVAYFCMEYAIHAACRIYSGGLGVLAGDFLKTASDMGVRCIGIGLFYRHGYFRQQFSDDGKQIASPEHLDPSHLPFEQVRDAKGDQLFLHFSFPGRTVYAQVWKMQIGKVPLYLIDTDVSKNTAADRQITSRLYPSDKELRLQQEIILGMGGIRLLTALGVTTDVYHCNEGHAGFMAIERIAQLILQHQLSLESAYEVVKASQLFTTHTSVPAAMDSFPETMLRPYFSSLTASCYISWQEFMALGSKDTRQPQEDFSMFYLAARTAQEINAVSRKHRDVSGKLLQSVWPDYQTAELPVSYVTNGIHLPSWLAPEWKTILAGCGIDMTTGKGDWEHIQHIPEEKVWSVRQQIKKRNIAAIRQLLMKQLAQHHSSPEKVAGVMALLQPDTMFIGFARRFTPYKRSTLLFHHWEQLKKILDDQRPVVFLFSGKAHPDDAAGLNMLQQVINHTENPHILFLEDYDLDISRLLVQGTDLWLNLPVRNREACGTSGMKALMNGVLQFSTPDGWWAEHYDAASGWALTYEYLYKEEEKQNEIDAAQVYSMLYHEIIPLFFRRNEKGIPSEWVQKIKNGIALSGQALCMNRMMEQYGQYYKKLAERGLIMRNNNYACARSLAVWKEKVRDCWDNVHIVNVGQDKSVPFTATAGGKMPVSVVADIGSLTVDDIGAEVLFTPKHGSQARFFKQELLACCQHGQELTLAADIPLRLSGEYNYTFRLYAKNHFLLYHTDMPFIKWA